MPAIPAPTMHRSALISSVSFDSSGKLNVSIQTDLLWSPVFLISMANLECGFMAESLHAGPGILWPRTRQISDVLPAADRRATQPPPSPPHARHCKVLAQDLANPITR